MEPAGVPALIAYRGGDKFAGLVPVIDEIPDDADLSSRTLEAVMKRYKYKPQSDGREPALIIAQTPNTAMKDDSGVALIHRNLLLVLLPFGLGLLLLLVQPAARPECLDALSLLSAAALLARLPRENVADHDQKHCACGRLAYQPHARGMALACGGVVYHEGQAWDETKSRCMIMDRLWTYSTYR